MRLQVLTADLHLGDCLEVLKTLPDCSVDSIVTDPPAGISFMGKAWDSDKGGSKQWIAWLEEVMREALRVVKPGGYAFVWALPRTSHWTATACEWAGWEIRDVVMHLFGTGFPKSKDVAKAIDEHLGTTDQREVLSTKTMPDIRGSSVQGEYQPLGKGKPPMVFPVTAPAAPAAQAWSGWGTALKPAAEHWILLRKPLEGTVAHNVLKHGTGGINIDGTRLGLEQTVTRRGLSQEGPGGSKTVGRAVPTESLNPPGRWPANVVLSHSPDCLLRAEGKRVTANAYLDGSVRERPMGPKYDGDEPDVFWCAADCAVAMLDEQSGSRKSGSRKSGVRKGLGYGGAAGDGGPPIDASQGTASRFFYTSKPSANEKNFGLEDADPGITDDGRQTPIDNPYLRGKTERRNRHPTVKPFRLMGYLLTMITPPGGTCLDLFMGSGTTGAVAVARGFRFIGIDQDAESFETARRRIASVKPAAQDSNLEPPGS